MARLSMVVVVPICFACPQPPVSSNDGRSPPPPLFLGNVESIAARSGKSVNKSVPSLSLSLCASNLSPIQSLPRDDDAFIVTKTLLKPFDSPHLSPPSFNHRQSPHSSASRPSLFLLLKVGVSVALAVVVVLLLFLLFFVVFRASSSSSKCFFGSSSSFSRRRRQSRGQSRRLGTTVDDTDDDANDIDDRLCLLFMASLFSSL